jgi:hypothetical protein
VAVDNLDLVVKVRSRDEVGQQRFSRYGLLLQAARAI